MTSPPELGVLEFCSALNGDDVALALRKLWIFVKIVRIERRLALLPLGIDGGGDEDVSTNSFSEDDGEQDSGKDQHEDSDSVINGYNDQHDENEKGTSDGKRANKKRKKRYAKKWMEDTKSYNVPFVATAMVRGTSGTVVPGQWPTGFLLAYLQRSPRAVELVPGTALVPPHGQFHRVLLSSAKRRKSGTSKKERSFDVKILQRLTEAHMAAVSELLSAFVPPEELIRDMLSTTKISDVRVVEESCRIPLYSITGQRGFDENGRQILQSAARGIVPHILDCLKRETGNGMVWKRGGRPYQQDHRGRHLRGNCHSLQSLTPSILVLRNFARTSSGAAREVVRMLSSSLTYGSLHFALSRPAPRKSQSSKEDDNDGNKKTSVEGESNEEAGNCHKQRKREKMRAVGERRVDDGGRSLLHRRNLDVRSALLYLASAFLESDDPMTISRAISAADPSGFSSSSSVASCPEREKRVDREQKQAEQQQRYGHTPGIVFLALRVGMEDDRSQRHRWGETLALYDKDCIGCGREDDHYYGALSRLLSAVRVYLIDPQVTEAERNIPFVSLRGKSSQRWLRGGFGNVRAVADLLGGEALDRLASMAAFAPRIGSSVGHKEILSCSDTYEKMDQLLVSEIRLGAAIEARRLLFILLADETRSPLLRVLMTRNNRCVGQSFRRHRSLSISSTSSSSSSQRLHSLSKTLQSIVSSNRWDDSMKEFLLFCLCVTPSLLPAFFRVVSPVFVGIEGNRRMSCLTRIAWYECLTHVMRYGPTVRSCLEWGGEWAHLQRCDGYDDECPSAYKQQREILRMMEAMVMPCVVPFSLGKKATFGKEILRCSSTSPLLLFVILEFLLTILKRAELFLDDIRSSDTIRRVSEILMSTKGDKPAVVKSRSQCRKGQGNEGNRLIIQSFQFALMERLPDVNMLLNLRSMYDAYNLEIRGGFSEEKNGNAGIQVDVDNVDVASEIDGCTSEESRNIAMTLLLHDVISHYAVCIPRALLESKFDWTKLLQDNAFLSAVASPSSIVSFRTIRTLRYVFEASEAGRGDFEHDGRSAKGRMGNVKFTGKSLRTLLATYFGTSSCHKNLSLHREARELLIRIIFCAETGHSGRSSVRGQAVRINEMQRKEQSNVSGFDEQQLCLEHEAKLWVVANDASHDAAFIATFQKTLDDAKRHGVQSVIVAATAWTAALNGNNIAVTRLTRQRSLPPLCFSPFLTASLGMFGIYPFSSLSSVSASRDYGDLVVRVATESLFYHLDPLPLASVVVHQLAGSSSDDEDKVPSPILALHGYASAILSVTLQMEAPSTTETKFVKCLKNLLVHVLEKEQNGKNNMTSCLCFFVVSILDPSRQPSQEKGEDIKQRLMDCITSHCDENNLLALIRQLIHFISLLRKLSGHVSGGVENQAQLFSLLRCAVVKAFLLPDLTLRDAVLESLYSREFFGNSDYESKDQEFNFSVLVLTLSLIKVDEKKEKKYRWISNSVSFHKYLMEYATNVVEYLEENIGDKKKNHTAQKKLQIMMAAGSYFPLECQCFVLSSVLKMVVQSKTKKTNFSRGGHWMATGGDEILELLLVLLESCEATTTSCIRGIFHHQDADKGDESLLNLIFETSSLPQEKRKEEDIEKEHARREAMRSLAPSMGYAVHVWAKFVETYCDTKNAASQRHVIVIRKLERLLSDSLTKSTRDYNCGIAASFIVSEARKMSPDAIFQLTLASMKISFSSAGDTESLSALRHDDQQGWNRRTITSSSCFYAALISYDFNMFVPPLLRYFNENDLEATMDDDPFTGNLLREEKVFDPILEKLLYPPSQRKRLTSLLPVYPTAVQYIANRIGAILQREATMLGNQMKKDFHSSVSPFLQNLADGLPIILEHCTFSFSDMTIRTLRRFLELIPHVEFAKKGTASVTAVEQRTDHVGFILLKTATVLCVTFESDVLDGGKHKDSIKETRKKLRSILVVKLFSLLPKCLRNEEKEHRRQVRRSADDMSTSLSSSLKVNSLFISRCLHKVLSDIYENGAALSIDGEILPHVDVVQTVLFSCLKFGIDFIKDDYMNFQAAESSCSRRSCLNLLRKVLLLTSVEKSPLVELGRDQSWTVLSSLEQIHDMITSHSKFLPLMRWKRSQQQNETRGDGLFCHRGDGGGTADDDDLLPPSSSTAIAAATVAQDETRNEVLRLMLFCVSFGNNISCNKETWNALLDCYDAGVTEKDLMIRRLLWLYEQATLSKGKDEDICFMDEMLWGGGHNDCSSSLHPLSQNNSKINGKGRNIDVDIREYGEQQWDWLPSNFDIHRVRSTLCHFPFWEELVPCTDVKVEEPTLAFAARYNVGSGDDDDASCSLSEGHTDEDRDRDHDRDHHYHDSDKAYQDHPSRNDTFNCNEDYNQVDDGENDNGEENNEHKRKLRYQHWRCNVLEATKQWRGDGPDVRYNPAFVLPLILSALEGSKITNTSREKQQGKGLLQEYDSSRGEETYVRMSKSLCGAGGLSLTLASLSCKCPALRQIAAGILCLFIQSMKSETARGQHHSEWKERPQLVMLLDSVQRGLAVARKRMMAQRTREEGMMDRRKAGRLGRDFSSSLLVPMLPVVSAVFLGRAALILTQPDHFMYGPINAFFLRLEDDHGAYRDVTRLPAFIGLFCSTTDDSDRHGQARKERLWALTLLRDGTRDAFCFRVAMRCHAPELLLSSFETIAAASRDHHGSDSAERDMILETLEGMIRYGGRSASFYLTKRLGFLSWTKGIVAVRDTCLPTLTTRLRFLDLLVSALEGVLRETRRAKPQARTMGTKNNGNEVQRQPQQRRQSDECDHAFLLQMEIWSMAGPIMDLFVDTLAQSRPNGVIPVDEEGARSHIFAVISSFLGLCHDLGSSGGGGFGGLNPANTSLNMGVSVDAACAMLLLSYEHINNTSHFGRMKLVSYLTSIPYRVGADLLNEKTKSATATAATGLSSPLITFCTVALRCVLECSLATDDEVECANDDEGQSGFDTNAVTVGILERVSSLASLDGSSGNTAVKGNKGVIALLLSCRTKCYLCEGGEDAWKACLSALLNPNALNAHSDDGDASRVLNDEDDTVYRAAGGVLNV